MNKSQKDFPLIDSYTAANGSKIEFSITAQELPIGFVVTAEETEKSRGNRCGYHFTMFATTLSVALGLIRKKIRNNLAVKYLDDSEPVIGLTHDKFVGRIEYSSEDNEIFLEVDGRKLSMEELKDILSAYEGHEVFLEIKE